MADITLRQANAVVKAAQKKAEEMNVKMDIAVVDAGANLKAFIRMDDAWLGSIDIAIRKAKTARFFDMNTERIGQLSQPGGPLYNIEHSNGGLISLPGGIPLKDAEGEAVGVVGVSGSSVENDHAVAEAGAERFPNEGPCLRAATRTQRATKERLVMVFTSQRIAWTGADAQNPGSSPQIAYHSAARQRRRDRAPLPED